MKKFLVIPVAAALTLGLGACGGDSEDDAGGSTAPTAEKSTGDQPTGGGGGGGGAIAGNGGGNLTLGQRASLVKVVACMRQKGYEMPEPTSPAIAPKNVQDIDPAKVNKDSQECAAKSRQ